MIPASHHGRFAGTNRLWFMPGTPARVSSGELVVTSDHVSVRWAHEGAPQQGELVLHGHAQGSALRLYGTYPAGDGSPDWGWRIVLDGCDPDHFSFRMLNVLPDGMEALAVDLCGAHVGDRRLQPDAPTSSRHAPSLASEVDAIEQVRQ